MLHFLIWFLLDDFQYTHTQRKRKKDKKFFGSFTLYLSPVWHQMHKVLFVGNFLVSCFFFASFLHNMCEMLTVTCRIPFEIEFCVILGKILHMAATTQGWLPLDHSVHCGICPYLQRGPYPDFHSHAAFASSASEASEEMDCLVFLSWGCLSICNLIESSRCCVRLWCRCIGNHWKRVQWEMSWYILSIFDANMPSSCKPVCPWRFPPI